MEVELKKLKDNPFRDFTVDPIHDDAVDQLAESIKQDGFWGGVVCRSKNGHFEIAAGHHRVKAAIKAGIRFADLHIADVDDASMIRIYATENATQRGNTGTAVAGSIASAIRFLAKHILTGGSQKFLGTIDIATLRGNVSSEKGLGAELVATFLAGVPGINIGSAQQQLAILKASGNYGRIITEVTAEIEEENKEALKQLKEAEKEAARLAKEREEAIRRQEKAEAERKEANRRAREAKEEADRKRAAAAAKEAELAKQRADKEKELADKRRKESDEELKKFDALRKTRDTSAKAAAAVAHQTKTFDFEGAAKHLQNAHQIEVFRSEVTKKGIAEMLPVSQQGKLARAIVDKLATDQKAWEKNGIGRKPELSGQYISDSIYDLVFRARDTFRTMSADEREKFEKQSLQSRAERLMQDFIYSCRGMTAAGLKLQSLYKEWPKDLAFPNTPEFGRVINGAIDVLNRLASKL